MSYMVIYIERVGGVGDLRGKKDFKDMTLEVTQNTHKKINKLRNIKINTANGFCIMYLHLGVSFLNKR